MSDIKFADTHNLVAFLEKPTESEGFEEIVDFLNANPIKYALTVNPTIYCSCVKQFWDTVKAKMVNGVDCLSNAAIFEQLTLMGYEKLSQKLTFYKAFFSPQWKFLIHTILQCLSAKTTAWNEFSSTMASAIICLATNQKFNFSMYIFDNLVKNVDSMRKQKSRKSKKKNTKVSQPSGSTDNVRDENVPTTSNDPLLSGEDRLKLTELMDLCTKLQKKVLDLEEAKTAQDNEIASLKKKVKKLEKRNKSRTLGLKKLRKVGSARKEVEVEKVFSTAKVTTKSATTTTIDELTLAQTLIEIKAVKPKFRGVMIQEPSEFTTNTTTTPTASKPSQDKGKAKMIESEKPLKKKDRIMYNQEVALNLQAHLQAELEEEEERLTRRKEEEANIALIESWDNIQAMMDADYQMAQQLQLKGFKFKVIKDMFDKAFKRVNTFVDYKTELVEGSEKRADDSTKRAGTELEQEVAKKQNIDDAKVDDDQ
ncbi:hypothetical protein Tco_1175286 [Tanacetum coccineum]